MPLESGDSQFRGRFIPHPEELGGDSLATLEDFNQMSGMIRRVFEDKCKVLTEWRAAKGRAAKEEDVTPLPTPTPTHTRTYIPIYTYTYIQKAQNGPLLELCGPGQIIEPP